jgi:hypothetical protein
MNIQNNNMKPATSLYHVWHPITNKTQHASVLIWFASAPLPNTWTVQQRTPASGKWQLLPATGLLSLGVRSGIRLYSRRSLTVPSLLFLITTAPAALSFEKFRTGCCRGAHRIHMWVRKKFREELRRKPFLLEI